MGLATLDRRARITDLRAQSWRRLPTPIFRQVDLLGIAGHLGTFNIASHFTVAQVRARAASALQLGALPPSWRLVVGTELLLEDAHLQGLFRRFSEAPLEGSGSPAGGMELLSPSQQRP